MFTDSESKNSKKFFWTYLFKLVITKGSQGKKDISFTLSAKKRPHGNKSQAHHNIYQRTTEIQQLKKCNHLFPTHFMVPSQKLY